MLACHHRRQAISVLFNWHRLRLSLSLHVGDGRKSSKSL